jgi:uncharacterized Zn finger protein
MATISGGVITKQSGSSITYKLKCDKCGTVDHSESTITSNGGTDAYTKRCSKCGNQQKVIIKG